MYSSTWKNRNVQPSSTVSPRNTISCLRLPALSAWWAMVTVTPEVSRIRVLSSGKPQAGMIWKCPPTWPGPALGHAELKPSHSSALVITPSPAPPRHGSAYWRAEHSAPKQRTHQHTSDEHREGKEGERT